MAKVKRLTAIKIAQVGAGNWGKNLVRNLAELGVLAAIVETNSSVGAELSSAYDAPLVKFEDALSDPNISGLSFATPAETHASLAIRALEAGKHVFLEKPLAMNVIDGQAVVDKACETKKVLMIGHLLQYHPAFLQLKSMVKAGELGNVHHVFSSRLSIGTFRLEENVWWSFAPHDISMVLSLLGEEPSSVTAQSVSHVTPGIADWTTAQFAFPSGARAQFNISWYHPFKEQRLVVIGDKGMAVFEDSQPAWDRKLAVYRHKIITDNGLAPLAIKGDAEFIHVKPGEPLKSECAHFIECLQTGRTPRTDGSEALSVLRALEAGEAALRQGVEGGCNVENK